MSSIEAPSTMETRSCGASLATLVGRGWHLATDSIDRELERQDSRQSTHHLIMSPCTAQDEDDILENVAQKFHRVFVRNEHFKVGCALCILLCDNLLTRTQVTTGVNSRCGEFNCRRTRETS